MKLVKNMVIMVLTYIVIGLIFIIIVNKKSSNHNKFSTTPVHISKLDNMEIVRIDYLDNNTIKVYYWNLNDTSRHSTYVDKVYHSKLLINIGKIYHHE